MNLLDPIWVIVPYCLGAGLLLLAFQYSNVIFSTDRKHLVRLAIDAVAAVALLVVTYYAIGMFTGGVAIPYTTFLWFAPFALAIVMISHKALRKRVKLQKILTLVAAVFLLAGGAFSLNNYFCFCATLTCSEPLGTVKLPPNKNEEQPFEAVYKELKDLPSKGVFTKVDIPSSTPNFTSRFGYVYLPPIALRKVNVELPVLVVTPGYPGGPGGWTAIGMVDALNAFAKKHHGLAPVVVEADQNGTEDQDTECINSQLADAGTYIIHDVPAYIKAHYPVSFNPTQWTIAGYSAGGECAEVSALHNPDVYGNFINLSGETQVTGTPANITLPILFHNSKALQKSYDTNLLIESPHTPRSIHMFYAAGDSDHPSLVASIQKQYVLARRNHYKAYLWQAPGGHSFTIWKKAFAAALPWMMSQINFTK